MLSSRVVSPVLVALASLAFAVPAQAKTDTYTFRDTLQSTEGGANGNTLQPVNNGTLDANNQPIITAAPAGTFVDTTIDAYACPNTPTVRGYAFPAKGGLKSLNIAPVVATGSYTISMIVKFNPLRGGYTRLIDFSDSTLDTGIYVLDARVNLYPVTTFVGDTFVDHRFSVLTMTRDAATKVVTAYVGTTEVGTYIDVDGIYATASNLYFFMDNTTGSAPIGESSPGIVTLIRVSDTALAPADLPTIVDQACEAASCGDGKLGANEGCDDGNVVDGDGCSATCKIENGRACTTVTLADAGADAGDAGPVDPENASCASNVCDGTDAKCGYANGAGSTCTVANAAVVCRSATCGSASGKCVPAGGCFVDGDCTGGLACDVATGTCAGSATASSDAGTVSFADSGLSIAATNVVDDGGCSVVEGRRASSLPVMVLVGIGAAIAATRRRRRR